MLGGEMMTTIKEAREKYDKLKKVLEEAQANYDDETVKGLINVDLGLLRFGRNLYESIIECDERILDIEERLNKLDGKEGV